MDKRVFLEYLTDSEETRAKLRMVYDRLVADGTAKRTFYDGTVNTGEEFIADVLRAGSLPFLVYWEGKPAGFVWLNTLEGRAARGHTVYFKEFWGRERTIVLGTATHEKVVTLKDGNGEYMFDVVYGLTPVSNATAWKLAEMCGGEHIGILPYGAWMERKGRSEDAVIIAMTRRWLGLE